MRREYLEYDACSEAGAVQEALHLDLSDAVKYIVVYFKVLNVRRRLW